MSPTEVANHLAKADEHRSDKESQLQTLEAEQMKLKAEIDRVYELYVDGRLTGEAFQKFYKPLEDRQTQLGDELPKLQAEVDLLKINSLSADRIIEEARTLYDRWPSLSHEEKQKIVESITEKIVIGKGEIDISLCCLPSSEELVKEQRMLYHGICSGD